MGDFDRVFRAVDTSTGKTLWKTRLGTTVQGFPVSFSVDGKQYIAVTTGWDLDARGVQNGLDAINKTKTVVPQGGTILVFKLQ